MRLPKRLQFLNDNHSTAIAVCCLFFAAIWLYGCESTTDSLIDPAKRITRAELKAETYLLTARIAARQKELDVKDSLKNTIVDQAAIFSSTGTFNPMGLLNGIISVIAVGSALDSKRKLKNGTTKKPEVINA